MQVSDCRLGALATYPDVEVEVLVRDGFDVKAYCGYGGHYLADLSLSVSAGPCDGWTGSGTPLVCTAALFFLHCPVQWVVSDRAAWP